MPDYIPVTTELPEDNEDKHGIEYSIGTDHGDVTGALSATEGVTLTTKCSVAWGDRTDWEADMLGWTENRDDAMHRVLPETCCIDPDLYCLSLELVGVSGYDGHQTELLAPEFELAFYRVCWGKPQYKVKADWEITREHQRMIQWCWKGVSSYQQIPGGSLKFVEPNKTAIDRVPVKAARFNELIATQLQIPFANLAFLNDLMGKINSVDITLDGVTMVKETLLFESWERVPKIDSRRQRVYDFTFHFRVLAATDGADGAPSWNKFLRVVDTGGGVYELKYQLATTDGTTSGDTAFRSADLNGVFG